jgi:hypothetical protein
MQEVIKRRPAHERSARAHYRVKRQQEKRDRLKKKSDEKQATYKATSASFEMKMIQIE